MSLPSEVSENSEKITIKKSTFSTLVVGAVIAIAAAAFFVGFLAGSSSADSESSNLTMTEMENLITVLEKNDADVQAQPTPAAPVTQPTQPAAPSVIQVSLDDDPVKGDPNAPVTIVEFSDFQCPFCGSWYSNTLPDIKENYIDTGKVKLVYRDMPLTRIHAFAFEVHVAAECADEQDKFWDYHDILFENQDEWINVGQFNLQTKLIEYATTLGLNTTDFESCLSSQKIADEVDADEKQARTYGASGTPTFFVGNEENGYVKLAGAHAFASFQKTIDELLS